MGWGLSSNTWTSKMLTSMWKDISLFAETHSTREETSTIKLLKDAYHFIPRTPDTLCVYNNEHRQTTPHVYTYTCLHVLLPKSVMRMGSCRGISGRGRLLLDTLALLVFLGNLCFFCCKLLKWEAMCVFLWPDVRKILSQWGQGKGRTPKKSEGKKNCAFGELEFRELDWFWSLRKIV